MSIRLTPFKMRLLCTLVASNAMHFDEFHEHHAHKRRGLRELREMDLVTDFSAFDIWSLTRHGRIAVDDFAIHPGAVSERLRAAENAVLRSQEKERLF